MENVIYQDVEIKGNLTVSAAGTVGAFNQVETKTFGTGAKSALLNLLYPIGSIYMSVNNNSPASFIGGSWTRIRDVFLLSAGTTYAAGSTGGSATHTMTLDELVNHSHTYSPAGNSGLNGATGGSGWLPQSTGAETGSTGGGQPFSIMPPYLAVYTWKRTA